MNWLKLAIFFAAFGLGACDRFPDPIRVPVTGGNQTPVLVELTDSSVNKVVERIKGAGAVTVSQAPVRPDDTPPQVVRPEALPRAQVAPAFPPVAVIPERCRHIFGTTPRPKEGWYPWFASKSNMTREEFIAELGNPDSKKLRVNGQAYLTDLQCLGFAVGDSISSMQAFLMSKDIVVVKCTNEVIRQHLMGRSSKGGLVRDYGFERKFCYQDEEFLVHAPTGRLILSLGCGNVTKRRTVRPAAVTPPPVGGGIPDLICEACV